MIEDVSSDIHHSEGSDCSHDAIDDDGNKPQPAWRLKQHLQYTQKTFNVSS
jgi:hypothetical protein